ncbi:Crp/Fnr family transcriptional regulator [Butyrivibrio sp. AE3004]|uniref:Crp/Fnr family transcriptional regulator n=1 Tax=Butyrivibrio sp. AE3004 TaxID=1506994 RepID=UPI000ABF07A1|nr:Crp/Fnr family transcriptional regulator [Butyrivibrio sp. AE3004]
MFKGISEKEIKKILEATPHHIESYDKGETIFHLMDDADRIGIVLEGRVEAQKSFPNGSQINFSIRGAGEMIGPAAAFSGSHKYPCDVVSLEHVSLMVLQRKDTLALMQRDIRILENFTKEIASATYMLQQRLELLSYNGIAQKAAFWLLLQARQTGQNTVKIPGSVSNWAMIMNVSRPSLHRELKRLEDENIISYNPPIVTIMSTSDLQDVLGV